MSHAVITVAPGDSFMRAMCLMLRHRMRDLPVMANGKLVGIVSIGDVAKHLLDDLVTETNVLRDAYIAAHRARCGEFHGIQDGDSEALLLGRYRAPPDRKFRTGSKTSAASISRCPKPWRSWTKTFWLGGLALPRLNHPYGWRTR
jgi:CBS domain